MDKITLRRSDLVKMIELIDTINPESQETLGAGMVTVTCESSSGIGSIINAELPHKVNGDWGTFIYELAGVESW